MKSSNKAQVYVDHTDASYWENNSSNQALCGLLSDLILKNSDDFVRNSKVSTEFSKKNLAFMDGPKINICEKKLNLCNEEVRILNESKVST